jgi:hypothetical protein
MTRGFLIWGAVAAVAGCHTTRRSEHATPAPAATAAADTLRGTFVLEGADPMALAVLRTSGGRVELVGVPAAMRGLVQLELRVRGTAEPDGRFRVEDFLVRAAAGNPAWDGTVERVRDGFTLRMPDGTLRALSGVDSRFAGLVGARVWVTETPAHTVASYGVIR